MSFLNGAFFIVVGFWFFIGMLCKMGSVAEAVKDNKAGDAVGLTVVMMVYLLMCMWAGLALTEWWVL